MSNAVNNAVNTVIKLVEQKYSNGIKFTPKEIKNYNRELGNIPDKNSAHTLASKRWTLANHALNMSLNPLTKEQLTDFYTKNFNLELGCLDNTGDFCKSANAAGGKRKTRKQRGKKRGTRRR